MGLDELAGYLDEYLRVREVPDSRLALNGLQVENGGEVTRVAAAVDASEAAIREAVARGCDLLLVHHGLFWDGHRPLTGRRYRKVKRLLDAGVAVYSAHVPLDLHPEVGTNAGLARELGIRIEGRFGDYEGVELGGWGELELKREALAARLDELLGVRVKMMAGGPERVRRVGVITGQGGSMIGSAIAAGLDAYVAGEGAQHADIEGLEGGINVYYGGHYAREVWGGGALAAHLEERFGLPWEFFGLPTGL